MNKNSVKYVIDLGLLLSFLAVTITGIIKFGSFLSLFGISLDYSSMPIGTMSRIHDWSGIIMAVLVLIHLISNWDWIMATTKGYFEKK